jgi:hypothetical protein
VILFAVVISGKGLTQNAPRRKVVSFGFKQNSVRGINETEGNLVQCLRFLIAGLYRAVSAFQNSFSWNPAMTLRLASGAICGTFFMRTEDSRQSHLHFAFSASRLFAMCVGISLAGGH